MANELTAPASWYKDAQAWDVIACSRTDFGQRNTPCGDDGLLRRVAGYVRALYGGAKMEQKAKASPAKCLISW